MILSLIAALFVLLVAAFWAFQGVFSAAIMLIETIVSLMVAFGFYESVHGLWAEQIPNYGQPLALVLLFAITLTVLRVASDNYIAGNMQFPLAVDRAGGGLLGLLIGLQVIGVALTAVQMLPLGRKVLGFERYAGGDPRRPQSLWLNPDGFAVGLANLLSSGRFGGGVGFAVAKPDFLADLYALNCSFQPESRRVVTDKALTVRNYWTVEEISQVDLQRDAQAKWVRNFSPARPEDPSAKFLVVRAGLDFSANSDADPDNTNGAIRFTPAQFRLVGQLGDGGPMRRVWACGMSDLFNEYNGYKFDPAVTQRLVRWPANMRFQISMENGGQLQKDSKYWVDAVFEVPPEFVPRYVEFKSGARVELTKSLALAKPPAGLAPPKKPVAKKPAAEADEEDEEDREESRPKPRAAAKKPAADADEEDAEDKKASEDEDEEDKQSSDEEEADSRPKAKPAKPKVGKAAPGRLGVASAVEDRTGVSDRLPMPLRKSDVPAGALRGGRFSEGHIALDQPPTDLDEDEAIVAFDVPEDKRMVQIGSEPILAGSMFGRAIEFAKRSISQIYIQDKGGDKYFAIGVYTEATISGKQVFELQYWSSAAGEEGVPERALREAKKLTPSVLRTAADQNSLKMGFLFIVPPGVEIVSFHTAPRGAGQPVEISVE